MIYLNSLPGNTQELFDQLSKLDFISDFYLSGGTGLSLQLNHRHSEDLDFFIQEDFDPEKILFHLKKMGTCEQVQIDKGTLNLYLYQVKLQFLHYPYSLLENFVNHHKIKISSIIDIACTKLITISSRGSKKDFFDLYFLLAKYSLKELFDNLKNKYQEIDYNPAHILKSLTYFEEAELQPDPKMIKPISWEKVKEEIIRLSKGSGLI